MGVICVTRCHRRVGRGQTASPLLRNLPWRSKLSGVAAPRAGVAPGVRENSEGKASAPPRHLAVVGHGKLSLSRHGRGEKHHTMLIISAGWSGRFRRLGAATHFLDMNGGEERGMWTRKVGMEGGRRATGAYTGDNYISAFAPIPTRRIPSLPVSRRATDVFLLRISGRMNRGKQAAWRTTSQLSSGTRQNSKAQISWTAG